MKPEVSSHVDDTQASVLIRDFAYDPNLEAFTGGVDEGWIRVPKMTSISSHLRSMHQSDSSRSQRASSLLSDVQQLDEQVIFDSPEEMDGKDYLGGMC